MKAKWLSGICWDCVDVSDGYLRDGLQLRPNLRAAGTTEEDETSRATERSTGEWKHVLIFLLNWRMSEDIWWTQLLNLVVLTYQIYVVGNLGLKLILSRYTRHVIPIMLTWPVVLYA